MIVTKVLSIIAGLMLLAPSAAASEVDTLRFENTLQAVGLFLDQCARPIVSGLPAVSRDLRTLSDVEAAARFGDSVTDARVTDNENITVFEGRNTCNLGMNTGDAELIRTAFANIFDPGLTGFNRARYDRDSRGGFRLEYFRNDGGRVLTFRADVNPFPGQGQTEVTISMTESVSGRRSAAR